jgi:PPM family protein phosphatase
VPESAPKLDVTAATNRGHVRPANEDAIVVGTWRGFGDDISHSATHDVFANVLLAVADGLGGHSAGDVASRIVIDGLVAQTADLTVGNIGGITGAITVIDDDLKLKATSDPSLRGMGSTLAMAVVSAEAITVLNVGDSRIYLSDGPDEMRQISIDDIPVRRPELRSQDRLSDGSVRRSSHLVTQALGGVSLRRTRLRPHVVNLSMSVPWTLLLCSDGLTDFVDEIALYERIKSASCRANDLVEMALEGGGADNISAILARCGRF